MGLRVRGVEDLIQELDRIVDDVRSDSSLAMEREAIKIRDLARLMAPVDKGFLESSIKVVDDDDRPVTRAEAGSRRFGRRNAKGQFTRVNRLYIFIDEFVQTDRGIVGQYAWWMHEGDYELGYKSFAKMAAAGVEVGPKFLERAAAERDQHALNAIAEAVQLALTYRGRRG